MRSVKSKLLIFCIVLGLLGWLGVSPAAAGVKWSQLPDQTPRGIDIRCDRNDSIDRVLADDFQCIKTAPITDVHIWGSWKDDVKGNITEIHLSIHDDIPADPNDPNSYSMPGQVLWEKDFCDGDFSERLHRDLDPDSEWWWDPYTGDQTSAGDQQIWRYDIDIDPCDAFPQQGTRTNPITYWLDVYVKTDTGQFGWKTSKKHWNDDAVYLDTAGTWQELRYPEDHPFYPKSIDMAFVIRSNTPSVSPYFVIDTLDQWEAALQDSLVTPINPAEDQWDDYMRSWSSPLDGNSYPSDAFVDPCLYAWPGSPCDDNLPRSPGMVMAWGDPAMLPGLYSTAWQYKYRRDPDLTDVMITVTVLPPCDPCISIVSFGMRDIFGNHRGWYWNVPGTLPCGVANTITIDTSILGATAANPLADAYMSDAGFDITQVEALVFDENWTWVGGTPVPPPGTTSSKAWNYWYDLTVTPKPVKTIGPRKWRQPPREIHPGRFLGWDEQSVRSQPPLMADDWLCKDQRPVTDIHWWGSHLGWTDSNEPPLMPIRFHFGIWTDVPKDPNDYTSFSHPNEMIWAYECNDYDYQWEFVGYDKDPRQPFGAPSLAEDSCFQYYCDLPEDDWFYQIPTSSAQGTVYWLSIAAIYQTGTDPNYPWGCKTRPRFFQDDAVRIETLAGAAGWPPSVGSKWQSGEPVEYPHGWSWDLSFELTTNEQDPPPTVDHNSDGKVNWRDFAIFANWWLADLRP